MVTEIGRLTAPISSVAASDSVMSADGSRLYVAGEDGKIRVFDVASRALIATWDVGVRLAGIDVALDGSYLMVAERQPNGAWGQDGVFRSTSIVYKVSTESGAVSTFSLQSTGNNYNFFDVAVMANGSVLVTQETYSGHLPLWTLDLAGGNFTATAQTYGNRGGLTRSSDGTQVLFGVGDSSAGAIHLWESGLGITRSSDSPWDSTDGYNAGVAAINLATNRIVQFTSWDENLFDGDLNFLGDLPLSGMLVSNVSGALFDPTGTYLYLLSDDDDLIYQLATTDWSVVRTFAVGANVGNGWIGGFGNRLQLSPDGRYFTVMTASGVRLVENDGLDNDFTGTGAADLLAGGAGDDSLNGAGGNDLIDGGSGSDMMRGGTGNDIFVVDSVGDVVVENAGEGTDEIRTGLATYSLAGLAQVENLTAISDVNHDFRGNAGDNVITGGAGNDNLRLQDGGDDTVLGGAGNDNIFMIGSLTSADVVDGGAGNDTLVLQGAYAGGLTLTANVTNIEFISILAGSNTNFGEPGSGRYDYVLTTHDANFSGGIQVRINGSALLAGEDFTFDGSAELDSRFVVYGGRGKDTLIGGQGNDIFFLAEERFATGDTVNGGAGYDGMFLRGNYTIDFNAPGYTGLFTNIENLTLTSATDERYARGGGTEFDYNLVLSDAIVKPGERLTVSGTLLMASETMILDASAETDGFLSLFAGKANDILKGGALGDVLHGNLGADQLTGNGGADVFRYQDVAESTGSSLDHILDFEAGTDKIDLSRIDADAAAAGNQAFSWIGSNAFSGSAGQLRAYQDGSSWFVEGDTDGDGVADLVIQLTVTGGPLSQGDFLP